jgi:RNA polymerase-associated protein LEO1
MDEEDIFGRDLSDDEVMDDKKELEEVVLRRRPMPSTNREFAAMRIPNILTIERKPFNPLKFSEDVRNGFKELKTTQAKQAVQLMNPENVIRWRFKKSEEGQILTGDDGRPQYESNSRIVEWEDGSRTLFVGGEAFNVNDIPDRIVLFEENTQEASVCHGFINTRLVATPRSLDSVTHEQVKRAQFGKFEPTSRSLLINTDDQVFLKQQQELQRERDKEKEKRERKMLKVGVEESKLNAAFLESDDEPIGPSVKRPKQ